MTVPTYSIDEMSMRRLTRLVWTELGKKQNPWLTSAASSTADKVTYMRWYQWHQTHISLLREMFEVVFGTRLPSEDLFKRALDFLEFDRLELSRSDA